MRLNEEFLERIEEFFDLISNSDGEVELDSAMDRLRRLLEEDIDGRTNFSEDELAFKVLCHMEEVWDLIPEASRKDSDLQEYFEEIMEDLEEETIPSDDEYLDELTDEESDDSNSEEEAEEDESWD